MNKPIGCTLLLIALLLFAACGGPAPAQPPAQTEALECQLQKYPCTFAQVPRTILEHTIALSDELATMLKNGDTPQKAAAWLKTQEGLAEVESDEWLVRFRLQGGRATWVLRDEATLQPSPQAQPRALPTRGLSAEPKVAPTSVVGKDPEKKRALVLSPFKFELGNYDSGAAIASMLGNTHGYEGNVSYLKNETRQSTEVSVAVFSTLANYDLIYLTSHGAGLCDDQTKCWYVLAAQTFQGDPVAFIENSADPGLELIKQENGAYHIGLNLDFFREHYPQGLESTLMYFTSCFSAGTLGGPSAIAPVLQGKSSVFVGWNNLAPTEVSATVALKMFEQLVQGPTINQAYTSLGAEVEDPKSHSRLVRYGPPAGGDLRIRQIVKLINLSTNAPLLDGDTIEFSGKANDGQNDILAYAVEVDGVWGDDAEKMKVHIVLDGKEVNVLTPAQGINLGPHTFRIQSLANLGKDLGKSQAVEMWAFVELPEGGISEQIRKPTVVGLEEPKPDPSVVWQGTSSQSWEVAPGVKITATAKTGFELSGSANKPVVRYTLKSGTLTLKAEGTDPGNCTYVSTPQTFTLPPDDSDYLEFTTAQGTIAGKGGTVVPKFEYMIHCPGKDPLPKEQGYSILWLNIPEGKKVENGQFSGSHKTGLYGYTWDFIKIK